MTDPFEQNNPPMRPRKTATEIQVEEDNKKTNWPTWIKQIELLAQSQDSVQKVTTDWMKALEERCKHEYLEKKLGEEAVCLLQEVILLEGIEKRGQFYALESLFDKIREFLKGVMAL